MGTISFIEEKLAALVEMPFRTKNSLDVLSIEIALKRLIEGKKKNILGKIIVPNVISIVISEKTYTEYRPFIENIASQLKKSLEIWIKEKGFDILNEIKFNFSQDPLLKRVFDVSVSFKTSLRSPLVRRTTPLRGKLKGVIAGELTDKKTGRSYPVHDEIIVIGRGNDCSIRLEDPTVSKNHAEIYVKYGKIVIKDLGSRNGTRVNFTKISKRILSDGDRITLGGMDLVFNEYSLKHMDNISDQVKEKDDDIQIPWSKDVLLLLDLGLRYAGAHA